MANNSYKYALIGYVLLLVSCDFGRHVSELPLPTETGDSDSDSDTDLPQEVFVQMKANAFDPVTITITVGDTVTWNNEDSWFHILASGVPEDATHEWISPTINLADSWSRVFNEPGDHIYYCDNHSAIMRDAHVIVEMK